MVLCLGPGAVAEAQLATALDTGNAVVVVVEGAKAALASLPPDPRVVVLDGQVAPDALVTVDCLQRGPRRAGADSHGARPAPGSHRTADHRAGRPRALRAGAPRVRRHDRRGGQRIAARPGGCLNIRRWRRSVPRERGRLSTFGRQ